MKRTALQLVCLLAASGCFAAAGQWRAATAQDAPPLHERIDQLIDAAAVGPIAPTCSDADFVRRIFLDLTGVIPTAEETRAFLADGTNRASRRCFDTASAITESPTPSFNLYHESRPTRHSFCFGRPVGGG
jgi:hypothetical protein